MPTIKLTQGQRMRYAREAAGLQQADIAAALHVSTQAVSKWESDGNLKGAPWAALKIMAELTGFPIEFLEPRELEFAAVTGEDTDVVTLWYSPPRAYDLPLFDLAA